MTASAKLDVLARGFRNRFLDYEDLTAQLRAWASAFPDVALEPVQVIASEDFVTAILDVTGTHRGDFQGHPATGKSFRVRGIQVGKFRDGKMTDRWGATDVLGILQQLGLA